MNKSKIKCCLLSGAMLASATVVIFVADAPHARLMTDVEIAQTSGGLFHYRCSAAYFIGISTKCDDCKDSAETYLINGLTWDQLKCNGSDQDNFCLAASTKQCSSVAPFVCEGCQICRTGPNEVPCLFCRTIPDDAVETRELNRCIETDDPVGP